MNIIIQRINSHDKDMICSARNLFLHYFLDLYKDLSQENIGITQTTEEYLNAIFDKTEQALMNNTLDAYGAFDNNILIGLSTFNFLEDETSILIRTLPINILYKQYELAIRNMLIQYITKMHTSAKKLVIMVRKANTFHESLCLESGFEKTTEIFDESHYIKHTYDTQWYQAFSLTL
jgi:hypothetical protein